MIQLRTWIFESVCRQDLVLSNYDIQYLLVVFLLPVASMLSPFAEFTLFRNPKYKNSGKFLTLSDFLALANNASSLSGVLISIEVSFCYGSLIVWIPCLFT